MRTNTLSDKIQSKQNFLCVGLDTDISKIPSFLMDFDRPVLEFNKRIIEATSEYCTSYKINTAFYESRGVKGWDDLVDTLALLSSKDHFVIADAKRGDIGNTARHYAKAFFEHLSFDAITINPYMGLDTLEPFLEYENKTVIALGLTSNRGAADFEKLLLQDNQPLYLQAMRSMADIASADQLMFVIGATNSDEMQAIREAFPDYFFLVPGIGAQGGDRNEVFEALANPNVGFLINSSRGIIFAGNGSDFAEDSKKKCQEYHQWMKTKLHPIIGN